MKNKLIKLITFVALAASLDLNSKIYDFNDLMIPTLRDPDTADLPWNEALRIREEARLAEEACVRNLFVQLFRIASLGENITAEDMQAFAGCLAQGVSSDQLNGHVNQYGETLLFVAVRNAHIEIVKLLLRVGANPNVTRTLDDASPLLVATRNCDLEVIEILFSARANLNQARSADGLTPLFLASMLGYSEIVSFFGMHSVRNEDAVNNTGMTPLMIAAARGHTLTITYLLLADADLNFKLNNSNHIFYGLDAFEIAVRCNQTSVITEIERHLRLRNFIKVQMDQVYARADESLAKRRNDGDDENPRPRKR